MKQKIVEVWVIAVTITLIWIVAQLHQERPEKQIQASSMATHRMEETEKPAERLKKRDVRLRTNAKKNIIHKGKPKNIRAVVDEKYANSCLIVYYSGNTAYATVSQGGRIRVKNAGIGRHVRIYARVLDQQANVITKSIRFQLEPPVHKVNRKKKMVALTFDDGPGIYTKRILRALKKVDGRCTFFVLGSRVVNYENVLRKEYEIGCEVGNHTWSHPQLTKLSSVQVKNQIRNTDWTIKKITGQKTVLMRPPYGAWNKKVARSVGKPMIMWSIDTLDWKHHNPQKTVSIVMSQVRDGSIVLMHDIHETTAEAVERLIPKLHRRGYQFVTVSELARYRKKSLKSGTPYYSFAK
ncbi:MAG: polysaccharide deacetylase family protein [Lachnospiraceae bacterium]